MNDMLSTRQAAAMWGYDQLTVWEWCRSGLIEGAVHGKPGSSWRIPTDAKCPRPVKAAPDRDG